MIAHRLGRFSENDFIRFRPDFQDEHRLPEGIAEAFPLSDSIMNNASVTADYFTGRIYEIAGHIRMISVRTDKRSIVMIGNKADLLAVRLMRHRKAGFFGDPPDLIFFIFPDGHQRVRQLLLRQIIQSVGLVFSGRYGRGDSISALRCFPDPCIMAGRDIIRAQCKRAVQERLPFDITVAGNAGIGRFAVEIGIGKVIHDFFTENIPEIEHIMRDADRSGNSAGIIRGGKTAARAFLVRRRILLPDLHGHASDIMTGLF